MNSLSNEQRARILTALVEGNSVRATCRLTGAAKGTVLSLLRDVGAHCKNYHDRFVTGVAAKRVQADEIWSFVGAKDRNIPRDEKGQGRGDVWTFTAIDADSKLMIAYRVGTRDQATARPFMLDLADRLAGRVQLTTDGHNMYVHAVENAFGWAGTDYAQLVKVFGPSPEGERRYSPPVVLKAEKETIMGRPDDDHVSTAYVERQNLTMRMSMRRFTRLTNAFSKKVEYHLYAVALHFMHYNFCRPHATLSKAAGVKTTPAMAAGLADRIWTVGDLLELLQGK
jgi:IS1 family transposase